MINSNNETTLQVLQGVLTGIWLIILLDQKTKSIQSTMT